MNCEECAYYTYDEDDDCWYCTADMDEDDYARMMSGTRTGCSYFRGGDEYAIVKHQM
ncbi:MAG: hypothetical protein IJ682_05165 [Lachnospiraceae bacterium]|nr:hypothetical protein [Lachnospiraceae bacterium]